jgi:hypothetical protein
MPATEANSPRTAALTCPLCAAPLDPANPNACTKCDWVAETDRRSPNASFRDRAAVFLSVIPGLGHIYKGHRLLGALLMLGSGFALFACVVAATASAGWGLLLLPLYWAGVMMHVYWLDDRALHHHTRG